MELIPKVLIVGVFAAVAPGAADTDRINRIWMQLSKRMGYRQLIQGGEGGAQFVTSPDDAFLIQPPLLQFRHPATMGFANAADDAEVSLKTAAELLGATQFANLGIKFVSHAPAPDNEAFAFVQQQLLGKSPDDLAMLERGGPIWAGVKYGISGADNSTYTLVIEPLISDPKFLFIDLDAQYPDQADLDHVTDRAADAQRYLMETVRAYLEHPGQAA
jgi:hypothetical protein